ncbi:MAG: hypothetical protein ACRESE_00425, partial [Gammaproteobacteria bacterium]
LWVGRARAVVRKLTEQIEQEVAAEEIRKAANSVRQAVHDPISMADSKPEPRAPQETVKHDPPAG